MGAVDLVIQVESPKSVARGLQRVGRAGPRRSRAVSKGRIFPKFRADLLESAVVARAHARGRDRGDAHPAQPARRARAADRRDLRRRGDRGRRAPRARRARAYPFAELSRAQLENVLDMLAGRYPSDEFAELRPRIVWDRTAGIDPRAHGRAPARGHERRARSRTAASSASSSSTAAARVGELDEEMVYEARAGQTFLLGASTWRIEEITRDRVLVSPAPGVPGVACRSGRARASAGPSSSARRSARLARARRARRRRRDRARRGRVRARRARRAATSLTFLREQEAATGVVPSDRTIVVERFRDEIGDWRVCILIAVRRARARAVGDGAAARASATRSTSTCSRSGRTTESRSTSRTPTRRRRSRTCCSSRTSSRISSLGELAQSALYGARFRENAARALLIPRRRPGQRTPLWQQRLKAQSLAPGRAPLRRSSRSCSRRTASACRTSSTCRR